MFSAECVGKRKPPSFVCKALASACDIVVLAWSVIMSCYKDKMNIGFHPETRNKANLLSSSDGLVIVEWVCPANIYTLGQGGE